MFSHPTDAVRSNQTLLLHGYIGSTPEKPTLAFSLRTLEIYRQIHRVCPRFTIDSLARTLNHLHKVPRRAYLALAEQLTTAYDAYLEILRQVEQRTQAALGRQEGWEARHVCPPCFYTVKDEPRLKFSFLGALDGNNSLKLVDSTFRAGNPRFDNRKSRSFRWLTPAEVDLYKDEVKNAPKVSMATAAAVAAVTESLTGLETTAPASSTSPANAHLSTSATPTSTGPATTSTDPTTTPAPTPDDDDVAWLNVNEMNGEESEELAKCVNTCVERWKAAGPEARKKMFALFAVAGIFISVCRHGHVLLICDMIRSGELMKYPLAIVARLFELYGADIALGYDIMCAFYKTLLRSSLGRQTVKLRMRGVVPAFHGHAHNRSCQLGWHPMYVDGVGLEDFEECEHTFCLSNNLANCTRLATPFHRQQQIDEHFLFHDKDKHAASGNFIFQNYQQAVEKITLNSIKLKTLEEQLHTKDSDYEQDLIDEARHLDALRTEPPDVARTVDYMELLAKYKSAEICARYRTTYNRVLLIDEELSRFEVEHGYAVRWTPEHAEYKAASEMMVQRRYRRALDELERLVVQRLMELTKLSLSGVAYKLRDKISKALKTRSEAIHRAVNTYNTAAAALDPPREQLSYLAVIKTVSLAEFDILRDTRTDICLLPWTFPARCEAATLYFGIKRAKEEIRRLNVEIKRLITFMIDDHVDHYRAIQRVYLQDPDLARELSDRWVHQTRINDSVVERLVKASRLPGFSGNLFPGQRIVVEYEEDNDAAAIPREMEGVDGDLIVQFMESLDLVNVDMLE
ncbi:hypothetical protein C8F04DRAFT_1208483 [Mycena alexandri]|uniref:CxC1-like cysteine cluster associated with KDZ transposases domain-containing protein n=1 Tax=Mycena alexandri TaxID=1745969 RepID=A0AAD6X6X6_9AGAR|nr:hypothetical protein C8F04DRAFT_1208483 [Mycena alexandri]